MLPFISNITPAAANPQSGVIKTWSFSILDKFESCNYRVYLEKVERLKQQQSDAASRGEDLHNSIESYIKGEVDTLPKTKVKHCRDTIEFYKDVFQSDTKNVILEENWGLTTNWQPTGWMANDVWGRVKLDAMHREAITSARIDDWKSGKKHGNEAKHIKQLQVYAIAAFSYYPELEFVEGHMRYIDQASDNVLSRGFSRDLVNTLRPIWTNKAVGLTTATKFPPNPNRYNCLHCPFAKYMNEDRETQCAYAVKTD